MRDSERRSLKLTLLVAISALSVLSCGAIDTSKPIAKGDEKNICQRYGEHSLYMDKNEAAKYEEIIYSSNIDIKDCETYAKERISKISPDYKISLCEHLAAFYYKGNYPAYTETLDKINHAQFADKECETIGQFFLRRIERKTEKRFKASASLNQLLNMQKSTSDPYKLGTSSNPIYLKVR